jgi:hypothetical protein
MNTQQQQQQCVALCISRRFTGWVRLYSHASLTDEDESTLYIMVEETVESRSGHRLCRRTLTHINSLVAGCWIVDCSWIVDSIQCRKLLFPSSATYVDSDVERSLRAYEVT